MVLQVTHPGSVEHTVARPIAAGLVLMEALVDWIAAEAMVPAPV